MTDAMWSTLLSLLVVLVLFKVVMQFLLRSVATPAKWAAIGLVVAVALGVISPGTAQAIVGRVITVLGQTTYLALQTVTGIVRDGART
jgi:hypothetical protein